MQEPRRRAFEKILPRAEACQALARLTAEVPQGRLVLGGETIPVGEDTSIKVSLKPRDGAWRLTVRLKDPAPAPDGPSPALASLRDKPRYKDLKKRMRRSFKAVETALAAGRTPETDALAAFVADSRLMTTYPGRGDPDYPAYDAAVERLEAAAAGGDLPAMTQAVAALRRLKKECHSRYA